MSGDIRNIIITMIPYKSGLVIVEKKGLHDHGDRMCGRDIDCCGPGAVGEYKNGGYK